MEKVLRQLVLFFVSGLVFLLLGGLSTYVFLGTRYVSEPWHIISLDEEFRVSKAGKTFDFDNYLKLEDRLFQELYEKIYKLTPQKASDFNRYRTGSRSDPSGFPINWNKTFELSVDNPRGGVLLIHGLTDSPYTVRSLAQKFHQQGFWVVGLRLPGHGTIPAGLLDIQWEDWAAAVRIGARRVSESIGRDSPLYLMGYSTGAPLAVEYALSTIEGENNPETNGLILLSPAMGLPMIAGLAKVQLALSRLPGMDKMAWESVSMEYDPYKYNSFPVNAGEQVYLLAAEVQERVEKMSSSNMLESFPRVIAFQSVVDATIQADAVLDKFLTYLPPNKNTLVVFDVNQQFVTQGLIKSSGKNFKTRLLEQEALPFRVEFITNMVESQNGLGQLIRNSQKIEISKQKLPFSWPKGLYSLSHVALPFSPDDPIYGNLFMRKDDNVRLGNISVRGEKKVFAIPAQNMHRLRHNPFYKHLEDRVFSFLKEANH